MSTDSPGSAAAPASGPAQHAAEQLGAQIERIEADLRKMGVAMEPDLASVDGEQGDAIVNLTTGELVDDPFAELVDLATSWTELSRERSALAHRTRIASERQPGSEPPQPGGRSPLESALLGVAGALRQVETLRHGAPWMREAADAGLALRTLAFSVVESAGLAPGVAADPRDRLVQAKAISDAIAPLGGNGLIDAVIWPACRRAGQHRLAEDITATTNALRAARHALKAQEGAVPSADAPLEALPGPQALRDELAAARAELAAVRSAAEAMYFALNDASGVVDASDDEAYAYQSELERGAAVLGIERDSGLPVQRAAVPRG